MGNVHKKEVSKRHLLLGAIGFILLLALMYVGVEWLEKSQQLPEDAYVSEPYIPSDAVEVKGQYYVPRGDVDTLLLYGMTPGEGERADRVTFAHLLIIDHEEESICYLPLSPFVTGAEHISPDVLEEKAAGWLPLSMLEYSIGAQANNVRSLLQLAMDISADVLDKGFEQTIPEDPAIQMLQLIRLAAHMQNAGEQDLLRLMNAVEDHLITDMTTGRLVNLLWKSRAYDFQGEQALCSDMEGREQHMLRLFWQPLE